MCASHSRAVPDREVMDLPNAADTTSADLIVIGAGAAGLATAIFAARAESSFRVVCIDGARRIGAKILVSGGSRCNVTNRVVTERDFWGGSPRFIRNVLRAFPESRAVEFFSQLGVALHEEEDGKLFPDSNSSRTVLNALLGEAERVGITLITGERVTTVMHDGRSFVTTTASARTLRSPTVALCTGGQSLPKTGSDGFGYQLARHFGHGCVATTPALAPLLFEGWADLAGVSLRLSLPCRGVLAANGRPVSSHADRPDAVDAFRCQRSGRAEYVPALAPRSGRWPSV